jgi:hypothetical protein
MTKHSAARPRGLESRAVSIRWGLSICAAWAAGAPAGAWADGYATPYAAEAVEYNTDIFALSKQGPEPVGAHGPTFADTYFDTRAGIDGTYILGQQKLFGTAEFRRFEFDNFTLLNHNEELFDGGLNWKIQHAFDGTVEYRHEERMVQFLDLAAATQLVLETENNATASFNANFTPEWRLESKAKIHDLDSPRVNIPGLSLHEESLHEGLHYLGVSNLSAGIDAEYLEGRYGHDPSAVTPDYHQVTLEFASNYVVSGFTNFTGDAGYTKRQDPTTSGLSAVTGSIGYQHSLTGKTSLNLQVNRAINTYVTTGGNVLNTSAVAAIAWQATYKISVKGGYSYTLSKYPQAPDGSVFITRTDRYQTANVEVDYDVRRWCSLRAYSRYQTRHSSQPLYAFDGSIVGVEIVVKRPGGPR